jgi:uncharacterized protein (TIGR02217 family)
MTQFIDVYLPSAIPGYPCLSEPRFSTTITQVSGGDEGNNQNWVHALRRFTLPEAVREFSVILDLLDHGYIMAGPHRAFPFRDPLDFASVRLLVPNEPTVDVLLRISATDQALGTGDGLTRTFQLAKTYSRGGQTYARTIGLPLTADLLIADNGTPTAAYTVTRPGGLVTFTDAPDDGHALTWGGLFDVPVRFESDDAIAAMVKTYQVGGAAQLVLDEVRLC